jgi:hypothetical protein
MSGGWLIYHPRRQRSDVGGLTVYHDPVGGNQDPHVWNSRYRWFVELGKVGSTSKRPCGVAGRLYGPYGEGRRQSAEWSLASRGCLPKSTNHRYDERELTRPVVIERSAQQRGAAPEPGTVDGGAIPSCPRGLAQGPDE